MTKIKELLEGFDGALRDLCFKLVEENESNIVEVFQFVCENYSSPPESKVIPIEQYFSDDEFTRIRSIYGDTVDAILLSTIKKCNYGLFEEKDFYSSLWNTYCLNFSTSKEKAFAFYNTLIDRKIPFQYIGEPLRITDTYKNITDKNKHIIDKIEYVMEIGFRLRTEDSSLILRCLDEVEDYESKVVVLAHALRLHSLKNAPSTRLYDAITERIDERVENQLDELFNEMTKEDGSSVETE